MEQDVVKFVVAVRQMREMQKKYFQVRSQELLRRCKVLERVVDESSYKLAKRIDVIEEQSLPF